MPICEGVDPVVQEESLIVERTESPFLGLNRIGVSYYVLDCQDVDSVYLSISIKSTKFRVSCMERSRVWCSGQRMVCSERCRVTWRVSAERCGVMIDGEWVLSKCSVQ